MKSCTLALVVPLITKLQNPSLHQMLVGGSLIIKHSWDAGMSARCCVTL